MFRKTKACFSQQRGMEIFQQHKEEFLGEDFQLDHLKSFHPSGAHVQVYESPRSTTVRNIDRYSSRGRGFQDEGLWFSGGPMYLERKLGKWLKGKDFCVQDSKISIDV